jgi:hypothetical protein
MAKMYSVNHWGSHPHAGNDDCWTGEDFATYDEALAFYNEDPSDSSTHYVHLDGPGVELIRENPSFRPYHEDDDWRREAAMQAGMAFGCQGYNDVMGY